MSPADMACLDARDRVHVIERAIAETHRGIDVRRAAGACSVDAHLANLARLERRLADARAHLADLTGCAS